MHAGNELIVCVQKQYQVHVVAGVASVLFCSIDCTDCVLSVAVLLMWIHQNHIVVRGVYINATSYTHLAHC